MGRCGLKKKGLTQTSSEVDAKIIVQPPRSEQDFSSMKSEFKPFTPPELLQGGGLDGLQDFSESDPSEEFLNLCAWDVAVRYHEFKHRALSREVAKKLRRISTEAILQKSRDILGSMVRPAITQTSSFPEIPPEAQQPELDVEASLEETPSHPINKPWLPEELQFSYRITRKQPLILSIDTSLSMTGEKLALTAVALGVVLLQFPQDPIGIVAFENEANILKYPEEQISIEELIERFLDIPAQGYTHLEDGLKGALRLLSILRNQGRFKTPSTVLLTDGKYTAGKDPAYLASHFPHLIVMKMGQDRASLPLCSELAKLGKGTLREVDQLQSLPTIMYGVVKDLLRGKR